MKLDLRDIQGGVLRSYAHRHAMYLFVRFEHDAGARRWLGELAPRVQTAETWETKPRDVLNVALTFSGLEALALPPRILDAFPHEFRQGMRARAEKVLQDTGPSHPSRWEPGLGDAHALVTVHAADAEALDEWREQIVGAGEGDVELVHALVAGHLPPNAIGSRYNREHFGFSDGFAQPSLKGVGDNDRGMGVPRRWFGWRRLAVGEFLLGHADEDRRYAPAPAGLRDNGTFMVFRKLHQDVARWRQYFLEAADGDAGRSEVLQAKVVGRWKDGSSLAVCPQAPDAAAATDNGFRYRGDPDGLRCPIGSHVRRVNPRDGLGWGAKPTYRHRIIRRGMPYGPPLPEGTLTDDGADRGLAFVCFQANLERQFEVVQGSWCSDGSAFGLATEQDPLLGSDDGTGRMTIHGDEPFFLGRQPSFVTTRGGEYLFMPGLSALRALADGTAARAA